MTPVTSLFYFTACLAFLGPFPEESRAHSLSNGPAAFLPLRFGTVKPRGWILEQMRRDLREGFAGHLDELCQEASSDIFATGRNRPGKPNAGNAEAVAWWNGETEGNWRCGHMMLACLTGEPEAMTKAKSYVAHMLGAQDADGYLGVFSPEMRYRGNGELWTQTCLFRGLLAYADATGDNRLWEAVRHAVDRTLEGYATCRQIHFVQHDHMYTDVLEQLYARTGDSRYRDFGLRIYHEHPKLRALLENPELKQRDGRITFNNCISGGHGATVTESMRLPLWLWVVTGEEQYRSIATGVVTAMDRWTMPSGAMVSQESVNSPPNPWDIGYEYCTIFEREFTLLNAAQKLGRACYADAAEHLWFNAAQGSRVPDGKSVLYCSTENRLSVNDEIGRRQRFSPTHQHRAVCCSPNATRIAAYGIANAWMRPNTSEPALAAMLYGPSEISTEIAGVSVSIQEKTLYPYSSEVELMMRVSQPVAFCLWLRNPSWSHKTRIVCPRATIRLVNGFWQVRKNWKAADRVSIRFDQTIREVPAINGEVALQYGPLLYVLPVEGTVLAIKSYPKPGFEDYLISCKPGLNTNLALPSSQRSKGYGLRPRSLVATGVSPDRPLDNPPIVLEGKLVRESDHALVPATLVPMGAKSARLRRVTFPIAGAGEKGRASGRTNSTSHAASTPDQGATSTVIAKSPANSR
ncbi:MAG: beta-L-arabinofuranosidase domain-containing protein [Verrucomicrobiota bacterium]